MVKGRDDKFYQVPVPLERGEQILEKVENLILHYKNLERGESTKLFKSNFDHVFDVQKHHILNCLKDAFLADGNYYLEMENGKFLLLRGTNRNESLHRRLNAIWPQSCGSELADALLLAFVFSWNYHRLYIPDRTSYVGYDPNAIRISTIDILKHLSEIDNSSVPICNTCNGFFEKKHVSSIPDTYYGTTLKAKSSSKRAHNGATMNSIADRRDQEEKAARLLDSKTEVKENNSFKWNTEFENILLTCVSEASKNNNDTINWRTVQNIWKSMTEHNCETLQLKNRFFILKYKSSHADHPLSKHEIPQQTESTCNRSGDADDSVLTVSTQVDLSTIQAMVLPQSNGKPFTTEENQLLQLLITQPKYKDGDKNHNWQLIQKSFVFEAKKRKANEPTLMFYDRSSSTLSERYKTIKKTKKT